ncbi:cobalamin biosynthesis protein CobG [Silicimonas algicola]|nr:cobalamin biosynthesis protein CobG [Silicimonas algicola]
MMSGDGLVVRVKPRLGQLTADQALTLAQLSKSHGNGMIDVTSRANLQVRGVSEASHPRLLAALIDAGLVDADPEMDARRAIVAAPGWSGGDQTDRLGTALEARLGDLPAMPAKIGHVIDTGPARILDGVSGDFRLESGESGLILRADGALRGRPVTEDEAVDALIEMAWWFVETGGRESGRMKRHIASVELPSGWTCADPGPVAPRLDVGPHGGSLSVGVAFGQLRADDLSALCASGCSTLDVTPWRMIVLNDATQAYDKLIESHSHVLITTPGNPVLASHACPGAPLCPQGTVETRDMARRLAFQVPPGLHVSGCAKGCAHPDPAPLTVVGCDGLYDVVRDGRASDVPEARGLTRAQVLERFGA